MKWNSLIHTSSYSLQVSKSSDFSTMLIHQEGLRDTSFTLSGLENSNTYYWRVKAINAAGSGEYSFTREFTTIVAVPEAPLLITPSNKASDVKPDTVLKWNSVLDAESYSLEISSSDRFSNLIVHDNNLTDTLFRLNDLDYNTTYFWRVNAANIAGISGYSEAWSFTTISLTGFKSVSTQSPVIHAFPNPMHKDCVFTFTLKTGSKVSVEIYNCMGQLTREIISDYLPEGEYEIIWEGNNNNGVPVKSGVYICVLRSGSTYIVSKILLQR